MNSFIKFFIPLASLLLLISCNDEFSKEVAKEAAEQSATDQQEISESTNLSLDKKNNQPIIQSKSNDTENKIGKADCRPPANLILSSATYISANNYDLTYTWDAVSGINNYEFSFLLNGTVVFQEVSVSGTTITFSPNIGSLDIMSAEVRSNCKSGKSTPTQSTQAEYKNSIAEIDIIFLADPTKSVNDICQRNCEKIKFTGNTILNTDNTPIQLKSNNADVFYLDFNMVKACIPCNGSVPQAKVDPVIFNTCLDDPANKLWIYDPNQYTVCQ
ncbi:MAG: hypothetical protein AB8H03_12230 [Saprospiraceae bacterium]